MNDRVANIINNSIKNKSCKLLSEDYEKRSEITKEKHLKKYDMINASFINFKMLPVNQDTLDRVDITQWYRVENEEDHKFLQEEFRQFLGDKE